MNEIVKIAFGPIAAPRRRNLRRFRGRRSEARGADRARCWASSRPGCESAAKTAGFKGKTLTALDILEPAGLEAARLLVVGVAPGKDAKPLDFAALGGFVSGKLGKAQDGPPRLSNRRRRPGTRAPAAEFALGLRLRAYRFEKYKTKKSDSDGNGTARSASTVVVGVADPAAARAAHGAREAVGGGRRTRARPRQRAAERAVSGILRRARRRASKSSASTWKSSTKRRWPSSAWARCWRVGQGSARESRLVAMRWRGAKAKKAQAGRLRRQGRLFRFRRHLDQAGGGHGGHEGRHGRRGLRRRPDARARPPQGQGQRRRRDRPGRKHARRRGRIARATFSPPCPARRSRSSTPTPKDASCSPTRSGTSSRPIKPQLHRRSGDADRRHHRRARRMRTPECSPTTTNSRRG